MHVFTLTQFSHHQYKSSSIPILVKLIWQYDAPQASPVLFSCTSNSIKILLTCSQLREGLLFKMTVITIKSSFFKSSTSLLI